MGDNWEYLAGGAMVIAGGVLITTGVGGPVGLALIGAGADTIIQKATTGSVNWGQVAISGAVALVVGPMAGLVRTAVSSGLGRVAATRAGSVVAGAASRAGSAVISGASRFSSGIRGYASMLPLEHMLEAGFTNGISGAVTNTGMYAMTESRNGLSTEGFIGAAAGGFVSGSVSSQSGYLAGLASGRVAPIIQNAVGATGSVVEERSTTHSQVRSMVWIR